MTREAILQKIDNTGIPREDDFAVPINGAQIKLPYQVVRTKDTVTGSDNGRVQLMKTEWVIALFSTNRDLLLEGKLIKALQGVGKVEIIPYPDGTPYQTNFKFTSTQPI